MVKKPKTHEELRIEKYTMIKKVLDQELGNNYRVGRSYQANAELTDVIGTDHPIYKRGFFVSRDPVADFDKWASTITVKKKEFTPVAKKIKTALKKKGLEYEIILEYQKNDKQKGY